ncbi:MAG: ATP-binding protein [Bacteroidota bacterium]
MSTEQQLLRILVVEDDEDDFLLINDYIKHLRAWKCEVKWIYRYDEAIEELTNNTYTICFSDYRLGAKNGIDLIKDLKERNSNTPVILLTGKGNYEIDIEATKAGAFDYLIKADLDEDKLERTIRYTLERMSNLKKIKDSERKYRNIFEKSKDIVFIAGVDTAIRTINYAVTDILEISVEESIGKKLTDFFASEQQAAFLIDRLMEDGEIENYELELVTADNTVKTCIITASIEVDSVNSNYIQGILHDVTSLKKAELASLQAEKLAATSRFIRTMAHEVRNPLNNINLSTENLIQQISNEDDRLYLEIIERNAKRINDLITELLQSSRPADIDLQSVSLLDIIDDVIKSVKDRATLRKIEIQFDHTGEGGFIKADRPKLEMALLNIVINAIEAVPDETGRITIMAHCKPNQVVLRISDNGCGMSPETKARLFEPYFTSKRNGLGLGLASTLTILNAHSAGIEVTSQLNSGTTFQLTFKI